MSPVKETARFPITEEFKSIAHSIRQLDVMSAIVNNISARVGVEKNLEWVNEDLERRIADRTADLVRASIKLQKEAVENRRARRVLQRAHDELKLRVQERTAELERQAELLRRVSLRLLEAQESERRAIPIELHDEFGHRAAVQVWQV